MTIYADEETALSGNVDTSQGYLPKTGFVENFNATVDSTEKTGSLLSKTNNLANQYDKLISIAKSSNPEFKLDNPSMIIILILIQKQILNLILIIKVQHNELMNFIII